MTSSRLGLTVPRSRNEAHIREFPYKAEFEVSPTEYWNLHNELAYWMIIYCKDQYPNDPPGMFDTYTQSILTTDEVVVGYLITCYTRYRDMAIQAKLSLP